MRPLVRHEFSARGLLLGADRSRILPELRPHRHRFLDGRPLAVFFQQALYVRELVDFDLPGRPARCPGMMGGMRARAPEEGHPPALPRWAIPSIPRTAPQIGWSR